MNNKNRTDILFQDRLERIAAQTDRLFGGLLVVQLLTVVLFSRLAPDLFNSPGGVAIDPTGFAVLGCAVITAMIWPLTWFRAGRPSTRVAVAIGQTLCGVILLHVIEGHAPYFHVVGSLAFLASYRDPRIFAPAVGVLTADIVVRLLSDSVMASQPGWWTACELAGWAFVVLMVVRTSQLTRNELLRLCERQVRLEASQAALQREAERLEERVVERTESLTASLADLEAAKAMLEEQRNQMFQFLDAVPSGVVVFNAERERVYTNDAVELFLRAEQPSWYVRGSNVVASADEFPAFVALETGEPAARDDLEVETDHGRRSVDLRAAPVLGGDGEVAFAILAVADITDRVQADREQLQAQKLQSVGQLAAGIAHEINTPMQYIGDNTQFVKTAVDKTLEMLDFYDELTKSDPQMAATAADKASSLRLDFIRRRVPRAIESTVEGVERVAELVRAMKSFSHPGDAKKVPTDINHAIETTLTVSRNEWKYVADVETDLDSAMPMVPALGAELNQVFLNLIVNAAHAIADTERHGKIRISTSSTDDVACVQISDDGGGIPPEIRDQIFNPFFTTKGVGRGTGQGLAIARSIVVEKHGGSLEVESTPGEGTTFNILLPLEAVQAQEAA